MINWKRWLGVTIAIVASVQASAMVSADKSQAVSSKTAEAVEGEYVVKLKSSGGISVKALFHVVSA